MNLTHLQLNTSILRDPQKVVAFINDNNVDTACLQEICYPIGGPNPILPLISQLGYHYVEGIHFYHHAQNQTLAVAIVSRWPIIDHTCWYYNTPNYLPKNIRPDDQLIPDIINHNYPDFPASRGLVNSIKSRCIISALTQTPSGLLRLLNTHFTVSDLCTEVPQMYDMSLMINSIVTTSCHLPTIFSSDLNIRGQSFSVSTISEALTYHTAHLTDTLSPHHRARHDFPDGLAIDHVFSKGLTHLKTDTREVDFSEHLALISQFTL